MAKPKAKAKKTNKLAFLSRFKNPKILVLLVFVLGFGGFGVWKLAFSSAAATVMNMPNCPQYGTVSVWIREYNGTFSRQYGPTLQNGSRGGCVKDLQRGLNWVCRKNAIVEDGVFGTQTYNKLKAFQYRVRGGNGFRVNGSNISVDGIAGKQTYGVLTSIWGWFYYRDC